MFLFVGKNQKDFFFGGEKWRFLFETKKGYVFKKIPVHVANNHELRKTKHWTSNSWHIHYPGLSKFRSMPTTYTSKTLVQTILQELFRFFFSPLKGKNIFKSRKTGKHLDKGNKTFIMERFLCDMARKKNCERNLKNRGFNLCAKRSAISVWRERNAILIKVKQAWNAERQSY